MPTIAEAVPNGSWMGAELRNGIVTLSNNAKITLNKYVRVVLPLDGFVFWVLANLLSPATLANASMAGSARLNTPPGTQPTGAFANLPNYVIVQGSLHRGTDKHQNEDETIGVNRVLLTTNEQIQEFNTVSPNTIYIGEAGGVQYAFSGHGYWYAPAKLWHYYGDAVYPAMQTQLISDLNGFDQVAPVVSNSLPAWLAIQHYVAPNLNYTPPPMFPSFAVPDNLPPPYISVHIDPNLTKALGLPAIDSLNSTSTQLATDTVELTLYGLRSDAAIDFMNYVNNYTLLTDVIGIMEMPIVRDGKRKQTELSILAQQKKITYEVNYYQTRVQATALQLIEQVFPTYHPEALA